MLDRVILNVNATPRHGPATSIAPLYLTLLSALGAGWKIEEPVVLYPNAETPNHRDYHFVLRSPRPTRTGSARSVVIAPDCPQVERFVQQMGWRVI